MFVWLREAHHTHVLQQVTCRYVSKVVMYSVHFSMITRVVFGSSAKPLGRKELRMVADLGCT